MVFLIEDAASPVFTPIDDEGNLNLKIIPEYLAYLNGENVQAVLVGGTTGEAASLNLSERKLLLDAWLKAAQQYDVKIISQVGGAPMPDVIELAKYSQKVGADAIMTLPELYFKPRSVEQLVNYLDAVAKAAPELPIIYYHFPMMSGVDVNMKQFVTLASSKIPTFMGLKADLSVAVQVADQLKPGQKVFIANHHIAPAVLMGHCSSIATVTNIFHSHVRAIVDAVRKGDVVAAMDKQMTLNRIVDAIASHGDFVPAMKATMELVSGIRVGPPRQPLNRLSQAQVSSLKNDLDIFNLI